MEAVFLKLLNMSISASYLVLAAAALRLMLKRAPRWVICSMWGLVALRLVCPFSLESSLSLLPSAQTVPERIVYAAEPTAGDAAPAEGVASPAVSEPLPPTPHAGASPAQGPLPAASTIWAAGAFAMLLYAIISYSRIRRRVAAAIPHGEDIWICDEVDTPFILGVVKPRVYLPSAMDAADMEYVTAHERAHLSRRDHWWKPLGFLLLSVYWFNPAMWLAYALLCRDIELACDEKVVKALSAEEKKAYSNALINCSAPRRAITACPLAFGESGVKGRIKSVLSYKKPSFWVVLLAAAACIALAVCFLTDPLGSSGEPDLSFLNYQNAIPIAAGLEELTAIYCPPSDGGSEGLIQIGAASGPELAQYLDRMGWRQCSAPGQALSSPGSVEFVIEEDYRIAVYQRRPWSLRQYAKVEYGEETRYYSIGRSDYPDAVALVHSQAQPGVEGGADSPPPVSWAFSPMMSATWHAAFHFDFDFYFSYSHIAASCDGGALWNLYDKGQARGDTMSFRADAPLCWAPLAGDELTETSPGARVSFTVYDGAAEMYSGVLEIERTGAEDGQTFYQARLTECEGLRLLQAEGNGGGRLVAEPNIPTEFIIWSDADLDHDGEKETILRLISAIHDETYNLVVAKRDGTVMWSAEAGLPHAGWNTILLYRSGGKDYLIQYQPTIYHGYGSYMCRQFSLEGGQENVINTWSVDFEQPVPITGDMQRFADEVNALLEQSVLLITTEQGELAAGPIAATEVPQIYPVRFDASEVQRAMDTPIITPETAVARYAEMEALFEDQATWYDSQNRAVGDWDGDGIEDSAGFNFKEERRREFTVELSGSGTQSIRCVDTAMGQNEFYTPETSWGWEYYFDTGDVDGDGADELLFAIDIGVQGGAGGYCLLVCPTNGEGIDAFTQIETGPEYLVYWEGETDTVRLECEDIGYVERVVDESLILPYMGTPEEAASRIAWMEERPDTPTSPSDPVSGFVVTDDGHIVTRQYMTAPGGSHSEAFGFMLTEYAYGQDGQLQALRAWFAHLPQR